MKSVMEAADTKKKAKPKKSDKDSTYFYPREKNAKYAEIPRNA